MNNHIKGLVVVAVATGSWGVEGENVAMAVVAGTAIGHGAWRIPKNNNSFLTTRIRDILFFCRKYDFSRCPGPLGNLDKSTINVLLSRPEIVQSDH